MNSSLVQTLLSGDVHKTTIEIMTRVTFFHFAVPLNFAFLFYSKPYSFKESGKVKQLMLLTEHKELEFMDYHLPDGVGRLHCIIWLNKSKEMHVFKYTALLFNRGNEVKGPCPCPSYSSLSLSETDGVQTHWQIGAVLRPVLPSVAQFGLDSGSL